MKPTAKTQDMSSRMTIPSCTALPTNTRPHSSQQPGGLPGQLPSEAPCSFSVNPLELSMHYQNPDYGPTGSPIPEMTTPCHRVLASSPQVKKENTSLQSIETNPNNLPAAYPVEVKLEYVKQLYHLKLGMDDLEKGLKTWLALYKRYGPEVDPKAISHDWDSKFRECILKPLYATTLPFLELMYLRSSPTTPNIPFILPTLLNKDLTLVTWSPMPILMGTAHIIFAMLAKNGFSGVMCHIYGNGHTQNLDANQTIQAKTKALAVYHKVARAIAASMTMLFEQSNESKTENLRSLIQIWTRSIELRETELKDRAVEPRVWQNARLPDRKRESLWEKRGKDRKDRAEVRKYIRYWCQDVGVELGVDNSDVVAQTNLGNGPRPQTLLQNGVQNQQQAQVQVQQQVQHQAQPQAPQLKFHQSLPLSVRRLLQQIFQQSVQMGQPQRQQLAHRSALSMALRQIEQQTHGQGCSPAQREDQMRAMLLAYIRMQSQQPIQQQTQQQAQQNISQPDTDMANALPTNGSLIPFPAVAASQGTSQSNSQGASSIHSSPDHSYQAPPTPPGDQNFIFLPVGHRNTPDMQPPLPSYSRPLITPEQEERVTSFFKTWGRDGKLWDKGRGAGHEELSPPLGEMWMDKLPKMNLQGFRWL